MNPEWLTVREVARALRVDRTTIRRWIARGILPAITLPHAGQRCVYRIHHSTLDALLSPELSPPQSGVPSPHPNA